MREEREERSRGESGAGVRDDRSTNKRKMRSVGMCSYMMSSRPWFCVHEEEKSSVFIIITEQ